MLGEDEGFYFNNIRRLINNDLEPYDITGKQTIFVPFVPAITFPLFLLFGQSLSTAKLVISFFAILTFILLFLINKKYGAIASISSIIILISIPLFPHLSSLYYLDIPIAFFSILSIYLFSDLNSYKKTFITAAALSVAFYTRQSAIILIALLFFYGLYRFLYKKDKKYFKFAFIACIITALTIVPWLVYNLMTYNYPNIEGLNFLFKQKDIPEWLLKVQSTLSPKIDILNIFTPITLLIFLLGFVHFVLTKEESLVLPIMAIAIFFLIFLIRFSTGVVSEDRYFSIIFPQIALVGGFFMQKLYKENKKFILIISIALVYLAFQGIIVSINTSTSQRYPSDYIDALKWIKENTPKDSIIFTAYTGSLQYYGERYNKWSNLEEFPEIMTTQNSTYIYNVLKRENISYILVWRSIVADKYIIPESNLFGVFTYNFIGVVNSDTNHFNATYQNQNNIIYKLL